MPSYIITPSNGVQNFNSNQTGELHHDVAIRANGSGQAGALVLSARKPGSDVFEVITDGTFDLSALNTIQFTGSVTEYRTVITGITGVTSISLTDTTRA